MRVDLPCLHMARICLESKTGLSIASGLSEGGYDVLLVRDANGLPTLPGTAIAGVLRHLYQRFFATGEKDEEKDIDTGRLFGDGEKDRESPSCLHVSWGVVHDSQNVPIEGLLLGEESKRLEQDPILRLLAQPQPILRDHVRLNHQGATHEQGKFDRVMLPPGCRFSLEISLWSATKDDPRWQQLLTLLYSPRFRLGGAVRRGLGAFTVASLYHGCFDLRQEDEFNGFSKLGRDLKDVAGLVAFAKPKDVEYNMVTATIKLKPEDFWRFGQGDESLKPIDGRKTADQLPLLMPRIAWSDSGQGTLIDHTILLPASSIKGALAHRFVFHLCRSMDPITDIEHFDPQTMPAFKTLFGFAKEGGNEQEEGGQAGRMLIDDLCLDLPVNLGESLQRLTHNSQDRFTGGVRDGALFTEELLFDQGFTIKINILDYHNEDLQDDNLRIALLGVLEDLTKGRLSLGAGDAKGHGYFEGTVVWSDAGKWIQGERS